ncbi:MULTISPECIES: DUF3251 domain-containing protein [Achromobacter]|uniref:DUF3251 domain-containing protein n=1 Tax=Achromobacter TaxID=222 RepID=UPI001F137C0D|nr:MULTISPECIES: DUF3251 domain-containing protein [Achromobacter]
MKRLAIVVAAVGLAAGLSGCKPDAETAAELQSLRDAVTTQTKALSQLEASRSKLIADVQKLQGEVATLQFESAIMGDVGKTAVLSVTEKGFSVAEMSVGSILISVKDVTPYANGVKVKLNIGNPTSATFPGLKLQVGWANAEPGSKNYDASTYQKKEISISSDIKPGMWNTEEIVLAPAKPDQVDYVSIKPSAPSVVLRSSPDRK